MIKIWNTLSRKKENFKPNKARTKMFVCGITPYDFAHIGHAKTCIAFDMIVKYLRQKGYNVFYLQNVTDIDDKIIKRAKEKKISPQKLARDFEREYLKDMKSLKIDSITKYARATDHIKEIISQVERLLKKGYAYEIKDGIYYDISKFRDYGKLSRRTALQAEDAVSRIDEAIEKKNKGDFCLWKKSKPGEPKWKSPFGYQGRPGWHIEDTAITEKFFGPQYDIHGGARELIFPHHEAEIAQMEAISGKKPMVKYWLHSGLLTVEGKKMSKSLQNFITIKDFLKKHSGRILRLFVLKTHYRSPLDYNEKLLFQTKRELERINEFVEKLQITNYKLQTNYKFQITKFEKEFEKAIGDDFNTPKAIAVIFNLINTTNVLIDQNKLTSSIARDILKFLKKIDKIFNFIFPEKDTKKNPKNVRWKASLLALIKKREKYRKEKNWKLADKIRKEVEQEGYLIKDTSEGPRIRAKFST